jgi:hypothetical protein
MLSIYFAANREWWVSSDVFERLFLTALEHGHLAPSLADWRHVAAANGGLSFDDDEPGIARELMTRLRAAARAELARIGDVDLHSEDGTYKVSLEKLVAAIDSA